MCGVVPLRHTLGRTGPASSRRASDARRDLVVHLRSVRLASVSAVVVAERVAPVDGGRRWDRRLDGVAGGTAVPRLRPTSARPAVPTATRPQSAAAMPGADRHPRSLKHRAATRRRASLGPTSGGGNTRTLDGDDQGMVPGSSACYISELESSGRLSPAVAAADHER